MRRADRLFRIIQILRRRRRPVTAVEIAEEMETSVRTIYRDIAQLMADRVPIRGEAGIGYVLDGGFDMPPLMLTADEVEAAMLGAQWVMGRGDPVLTRAASDLVAKIGAVVPEHLRPLLVDPASVTPPRPGRPDAIDMARLRGAIRAQGKLAFLYRDESGAETRARDLAHRGGLFRERAAHCGLVRMREAFRHFRTDRIVRADFPRGALSHARAPDCAPPGRRNARRQARAACSPTAIKQGGKR